MTPSHKDLLINKKRRSTAWTMSAFARPIATLPITS